MPWNYFPDQKSDEYWICPRLDKLEENISDWYAICSIVPINTNAISLLQCYELTHGPQLLDNLIYIPDFEPMVSEKGLVEGTVI
jgi:hypothetical protein